jgi:hypothetical protein
MEALWLRMATRDGVGCMRIGGGERNQGGAQVLVAYFTGGIVRAIRRKTVLTTLV